MVILRPSIPTEGPKDLEILRRLRRLRMTILMHVSLAVFFSVTAFAEEKAYDYLIQGAWVFDGESLVPMKQDLAIAGDRIVQVGTLDAGEAKEVIEADGLVAAPGFIDFHTHSDFNPFVYPNLGNKLLQGVTTEVVGNCGMSAAPIEGRHRDEIRNVWRREGVEIPAELPWKNFSEYQSEAEFLGLETNLVTLVGHGNLRSAVMGMEPRAAGSEEIESMRQLLNRALEEGAFGVSFGLTYLPGIFAAPEELVTLCREAGKRGGICAFHIRSEGKGLVEAVEEAIQIGKEAKAPVHISHLKAAGRENWPKIDEAFRRIEAAQAEGFEVTADAYPYAASFAELGVVLPDKIYQDPNRIGRLKDPAQRAELLKILEEHFASKPASWDRIRVATVTRPENFPLQGKTLSEIAQIKQTTPVEALVNLLAEEEFNVSAFYFSQSEEVVRQVLSKPYVFLGSDSIADGSAMPHPRAYGTFPKIFSRCAKGETVLQTITQNGCWGKTISQMTGEPAKRLGLSGRGRIASGFAADLVLLDPQAVRDRADYENPKTPPEGIQWVFVNGKPVVWEGRYSPIHSGLFLAREK